MLENVRYGTNSNISTDDTRIKSPNFASPSFAANPQNTVDTTPQADTYSPNQANPANPNEPKEMGSGEKLAKYIIPTGLVLNYGTKVFDKACGGEYDKSILGKLGRWGNSLSEKLKDNKLAQGIKKHVSSAKTKLNNFVSRHETLSTMRDMHTNPECTMVTSFLETQKEADLKEATNKLEKFINDGPKSLKDAGATKDEIKAFTNKYGANALEEFQKQKMFSNPGAIPKGVSLKDLRMQYFGLDEAKLNSLKSNPEKYAKEIEKLLGDAKELSPKMSTYLNKLLAMSKPTTKLGRLFPKMAKLGMRGLTFGGGFWNSMFIAMFLGDAVKNTVDAPKDQKVSTAVNGLFDAVAWVVSMPLALKGMHALGGLKNLGRTKAQNEGFKKEFNLLKEAVKNGTFTYDKTKYKNAQDAVKAAHNALYTKYAGAEVKGFKKVLKGIGKFLSVGLEQTPVIKDSTKGLKFSEKAGVMLKNIGRKIKVNGPKNMLGYPLRFALYMLAFQPVVDKIFKAPLNAIFGKPYDPEEIKEKQEKEDKRLADVYANRTPSLIEAYGHQDPNATEGLKNINENDLADNNLIKQTLKENNALPPKSAATPAGSPNEPQVVNGVQINTINGDKPYMPENTQPNGQTPAQGQNPYGPKDPNQSDIDVQPRTYVPQLDGFNVKYGDPAQAQTNAEAQKVYDAMTKTEEDVNKFIANGYQK